MTYDPKKVIDIALAEVGYLEKNDASNLDDKTANAGNRNYTKYARDLDAINFYNGRKQSVAWCDVFVDWCFVKAYGKDAALALTCQPTNASSNCGAGCKYSRTYYKNKGQLYNEPKIGDQIFFWPKDRSDPNAVAHTGLVRDVDSKYVYTIEGNTSGANGVIANGGGVCSKKYSLTSVRIAGYGRPNYGMNAVIESEDEGLRKNDQGQDVTELQKNLLELGYSLGTYGPDKNGVDGKFGSKTETALKKFQKANGLTETGVYDLSTMEAMKKAIAGLENPPAEDKPPVPTGEKVITITAKSVNARVGDSTKYDSVGQLNMGDVLEYVATAPNGWNAGRHKNRIVWVSPKYSKVTG